jgi:hypothetical protein
MDWFIIISIITIFISLFVFFEIFRYIQLHFSNSEKYIEQYKDLDPASKDKKVIISLGGNDKDIKNFKAVLNSLLDQTVRVNNIYINLYRENDNKDINDISKIANIFNCGTDYKNSCKFIPTALREDKNDTIIILLDNDVIYGKTFIENLVDEYEKNKKSIISNHGILITADMIDYNKMNNRNGKNLDDNWIKNCIKDEKKHMSFLKNYKKI